MPEYPSSFRQCEYQYGYDVDLGDLEGWTESMLEEPYALYGPKAWSCAAWLGHHDKGRGACNAYRV